MIDDNATIDGDASTTANTPVPPADECDETAAEHSGTPAVTEPTRRKGIRDILYKLPGSREQVPATEASQTDLSQITATTVLLDRSGSEQITADRVSLDHSGARAIQAKSAQLDRSGVVALGSNHTVLLHSSAVQVVADEARLTDSAVVFLSSGNATLDNSRVIFFNGSTTGDVQVMMTTRTLAILGGAVGIVLMLVMLISRIGSRR